MKTWQADHKPTGNTPAKSSEHERSAKSAGGITTKGAQWLNRQGVWYGKWQPETHSSERGTQRGPGTPFHRKNGTGLPMGSPVPFRLWTCDEQQHTKHNKQAQRQNTAKGPEYDHKAKT